MLAAGGALALATRPQLWSDDASLGTRAILAALLLGGLLCSVHAFGLRPERRPLAALARPPLAWLVAIAGIAAVAAREIMSVA